MKDNTLRASQIIFMFRFFLALLIVVLCFGIYKQYALSQFEISTADSFTWIDTVDALLALGRLIMYIICIVFFIRWFRRAYDNLQKSGEYDIHFSEGWAAGSWFFPFLNLVRPYKIMIEIWDANQRQSKFDNSEKDSSLIGWWWAFWLIANFLSNIVFRLENSSFTIDELLRANVFDIVATVLLVVALILILKIIGIVSSWEKEWYEANDALIVPDYNSDEGDSGYAQPYTT